MVRVVDSTTRIISTLAGTVGGYTADGYMALNSVMSVPRIMAYRAWENALYVVAVIDHNVRRIQLGPANAIPPLGFMTVVAGVAGATGSSGDGGPAASAKLYGNAGVAFDSLGNMFIADQVNIESCQCIFIFSQSIIRLAYSPSAEPRTFFQLCIALSPTPTLMLLALPSPPPCPAGVLWDQPRQPLHSQG